MYGSTEVYDSRIETAKLYDLKWAYIAAWVFTLTVVWLNFYPAKFKVRVMGMGSICANMLIYKLATDNEGEGSAVILHTTGDLGAYNRSNRSIHNFLEHSLPFVLAMPLGFFTFPFPAFVIVCVFVFGRMLHQYRYTVEGWGAHILGFLIDRIANFTMLGFLALAAYKQF